MSTTSTTREHVILARGCNRRSFLLTVLAGAIAAGFPTGPGNFWPCKRRFSRSSR